MEPIEHALRIAERSGLKKHKTGCVIKSGSWTVAEGWSHYSEIQLKETFTLHAELHAIFRAYKADLPGATAYIATFSSKSGNPCLSKPCSVCLPALKEVGVKKVVYTLSANGELITEELNL